MNIRFYHIVIVLCLIAGFYLRFERLSDLAYFQLDEEKDAFLVRRLLVEHKPILVAAGIPGGINMGPAFIYISSFFMWLSGMNPLGEAVAASFLGMVTILLIYIIIKTLFDKPVALLAAIFYTFSYLVLVYNRIYWPLVFNPILSLLTYYFLFLIIQKKRMVYVYPLSLFALLMTQTEASNLSTLLLIIIFWFYYRLPIKKKEVLIGMTLFILGQLPVILFDLRHDFLNSRRIVQFFQTSHQTSVTGFHLSFTPFELIPKVFARLFLISGPNDLIKQILPCQHLLALRDTIPQALVFVTFLLLLFFSFRAIKKRHFGLRLIFCHLVIILVGITIYNIFFPGYVHEWFFYGFFPALCIIGAYGMNAVWKKVWLRPVSLLVLGLFIVTNVQAQIQSRNSFGLRQKIEAVTFAISQIGEQPFYLNSIGPCYSYSGYRYLFWLLGREPTTSYMDAVFGDWVYPLYRGDPPKHGVVLVHHSEVTDADFTKQYQTITQKAVTMKTFDMIEVLIIK